MPLFLVAKSRVANGHFEVHRDDCAHVPPPPHRLELGRFEHLPRAVEHARLLYPRSVACSTCEARARADAPDERPQESRVLQAFAVRWLRDPI